MASDVKNVPTRRPHDAHSLLCHDHTTLQAGLQGETPGTPGRGTGAGGGSGGGGGGRSGPLEARTEQSATPTTFSFFSTDGHLPISQTNILF